MPQIEVSARFKNCNIKDKTVLQFELSASSIDKLPELTRLANSDVVLTIESAQTELPVDAEYEAEPADDQDPIPFDGEFDDTYEILDAMTLPEPDEGEEE